MLEVNGEEQRFFSKFANYAAWEAHYTQKNTNSRQKEEERFQPVGTAISASFNPWA